MVKYLEVASTQSYWGASVYMWCM